MYKILKKFTYKRSDCEVCTSRVGSKINERALRQSNFTRHRFPISSGNYPFSARVKVRRFKYSNFSLAGRNAENWDSNSAREFFDRRRSGKKRPYLWKNCNFNQETTKKIVWYWCFRNVFVVNICIINNSTLIRIIFKLRLV